MSGYSQSKMLRRMYSSQAKKIWSQEDAPLVEIGGVTIEGNMITSTHIIRREIQYEVGDFIPKNKLDSIAQAERNRIFNLNLFVTVKVQYKADSLDTNRVTMQIKVKEQWYTIPQVVFDIIDRNYNEWIYQRGADLSRVNLGIKLLQRNVRGRNETLRLTVQGGFTDAYELGYIVPFLDRKQHWGAYINGGYNSNNSIAFADSAHQLRFLKIDGLIRENYKVTAGTFYRKQFFTTHDWSITYNNVLVADTVVERNPYFFSQERRIQEYVSFRYTLTDDRRDIRQFATKGIYSKVDLETMYLTVGVPSFLTRLYLTHAQYYPLSKRFYFASKLRLKVSFPLQQPFSEFKGLGYGQDYVRGYDFYAIEANHFALWRNSMRLKALSLMLDFKKAVPIKQFRVMPVDVYFTVFGDVGYAYNGYDTFVNRFDNTRFTNVPLGSVGLGLNIVTFYNSILRFEYSYLLPGQFSERIFFAMTTDI